MRNVYRLVVARQPVSIPDRTEMTFFAPYLSKELREKIESARGPAQMIGITSIRLPPFSNHHSIGLRVGCSLAEKRKPRLVFSTSKERTLRRMVLFRVFVRLTRGMDEKPWIWHVAAIVVRKRSGFVIDDVAYLKDEPDDIEMRLSEALADGCNGPHGIGNSDRAVN